MSVMKKMIKIYTRGPIYAKGSISGPILTPYMEDINTIFRMISQRIQVSEVLSDNSEVVLTIMNFDSVITPTPQPQPDLKKNVTPLTVESLSPVNTVENTPPPETDVVDPIPPVENVENTLTSVNTKSTQYQSPRNTKNVVTPDTVKPK